MQKTLFDKENAQKIANQATDICHVYNQLSCGSLTKLELLSSFAKVFGYKSGWSELMAVNKSKRFYIGFSMSVCSHMRAIIKELSKFLPSSVDAELLLVAVSFTELSVKNPDQLYKCRSVSQFELDEFVLWFTSDVNTPLKHLAKSPSAARLERQGIYLKHVERLWPELHKYLSQKYKLLPEQVLLFERPIWLHYYDRFVTNYQSSEIGHWEIHFEGHKSPTRICYEPIYIDEGHQITEEMSSACAEGLSGCRPVTHFSNDMVDEHYMLACFKYWEALPHIKKIRFSLKNEYLKRLKDPIPSVLKPYITDHNESMDSLKNHVTSMDFTQQMWGYEQRFIFNGDGSKRIYQEPWIIESDIKKFIDVSEEIHKDSMEFDRLKFVYVGQMLDDYNLELFT